MATDSEIVDAAAVSQVLASRPVAGRLKDGVPGAFADAAVRLKGTSGRGGPDVSPRYVQALGITALCTGIAFPVYPHFDPVNIAMLYLLGTTLAALRLGRGPSALNAVSNVIAFDYFFVPPRYSLYVAEPQYLFTFAVMLGVALVIANLMANIRRQTESAAARERQTAMLYAMSRELAVAADARAIAEVARRHVSAAIDGFAAVVLTDSRGLPLYSTAAGEAEQVVDATVHWVLDHGESTGRGTRQAAEAPSLYLPLKGTERPNGVLVARAREGGQLLPEQERMLEALAGQIGLALERARLAELAAAARAAAERTTLRNTLLASISHDLRAPLSVIAGAGSLVAQSDGSLDRHRRTTLGQLIEEKARDMSELLTNVLELMRLETTTGLLKADWQSLEELVGTAVRYNDYRLARWRVVTAIPAELPLVLLDGQLIVQLISNLLENAAKHTPPGAEIVISASTQEGKVLLAVEDNGPGFGSSDPERLFEKFERGAEESHISGVGLGLAICRAIARLHGGEIRAMNRPTGGARFEITLPLATS